MSGQTDCLKVKTYISQFKPVKGIERFKKIDTEDKLATKNCRHLTGDQSLKAGDCGL
jgi:hypothetical protein